MAGIGAQAAVWPVDAELTNVADADEFSWPLSYWEQATASEVGLDNTKLEEARDYALTGGGSGYIIRHGKLVMSWGDSNKLYDLKSSTKSIGVTALGLAMLDGKIGLYDKAIERCPSLGVPPQSNTDSGWTEQITVQQLATQTAGFEKPGGYSPLLFRPGTKWNYSDSGPNWLAECLLYVYRRDLRDLMFERVFTPLGITNKDLVWRNHEYREPEINDIANREFASGISADIDAMSRIGYLYLRRGRWNGQRIVSESFVDAASAPPAELIGLPVLNPERYGNASDHYGLLWWNNADGTLAGVPQDAYWSWGLYDSLIVVIPSLDIVVARAGRTLNTNWWQRLSPNWTPDYNRLAPLLEPIAQSVVRIHDDEDNASSSQRRQMLNERFVLKKAINQLQYDTRT